LATTNVDSGAEYLGGNFQRNSIASSSPGVVYKDLIVLEVIVRESSRNRHVRNPPESPELTLVIDIQTHEVADFSPLSWGGR